MESKYKKCPKCGYNMLNIGITPMSMVVSMKDVKNIYKCKVCGYEEKVNKNG